MSEQTEHTVNSPTESSQRPAPQENLGQAGRRGPFRYGERIQVTDTKGRKNTFLLDPHGYFQSVRGSFHHRDVVGMDEGSVIETDTGHELLLLRPLLADYVLSMPRGAQVVYPKDSGQVIAMGDIFPGARVLEAGVGSGALTMNLLSAIGEGGVRTSPRLPPPTSTPGSAATIPPGSCAPGTSPTSSPPRWNPAASTG